MRTVLALLVLAVSSTAYSQTDSDTLLTIPEKNNYEATSKYTEVVELSKAIAKTSPKVRYLEFGRTVEGRTLPLMILSDPPVKTPEEAAKTGKVIVFSFANIHAGEVDGKEAMLMLARELATSKSSTLLKQCVFMVAPIFNADGNERFDVKNRRTQNGPKQGMGIRENAEGFDLNRDFVKLETPEVRSLVKLMDQWNPHIIIDCHTTNGSYHRHTITYDCTKHPAADAALVKFCVDKMMPDVSKRLDTKGGWKSFYYGNFNRDRTQWETYGMQPRFSTQYCALRNRIGILSESYSYASFKDRIFATKDFVHSILEFAVDNSKDVLDKVNTAIKNCELPSAELRIPLKMRLVAYPDRYTILGFAEEMKDGQRVRTEIPKDYPVTYIGNADVTETTSRPYAYIFPAKFSTAADTLRRHGIKVHTLSQAYELDAETQRITKLTKSSNAFQRHRLVQADAELVKQKATFPAGSYLVRSAQPLGSLACYLLEPRSDDSLMTWNYFDDGLTEGTLFPVVRLPKAELLETKLLPPIE